MCDLAEAMMLEQLERRVLVERQVSAVIGVAAGTVDLATLEDARARLLESLAEEAKVIAPQQMDLMIALGLQ